MATATEVNDSEFEAFLIGYYEGVMSDDEGEADMAAHGEERLNELRDAFESFKADDWTFPAER